MDVGVDEVINLAWKLGGMVWKCFLLTQYETERQPEAETLLRQDKAFSTLISGKTREDLGKATTADPNELQSRPRHRPLVSMVNPGHRAPDALLYPRGARIPLHRFQLTNDTGLFWILVIAGLQCTLLLASTPSAKSLMTPAQL